MVSGNGKRGRRPTGWTQIGVKLNPDLLAQLDAWVRQQSDSPKRPEAVRRLIAIATLADESRKPTEASSLQIGDRVRSAVYGDGRVVSLPRVSNISAQNNPGIQNDIRWSAEVAWDRAEWEITMVETEAVVLLERAPPR